MIEGNEHSLIGRPPIEVHQIGTAYFVQDGNHRVSVARGLGFKSIEAYATEVQYRVPITSETRVDDLIIKAEYADFLERIPIDQIRPEADLSVSVASRYQTLEEYIAVHRYYMRLEQKRKISTEEAIQHWYDSVYLPAARGIHNPDLLQGFPGRTETDLDLWAMDHLPELQQAVGWDLDPTEGAYRLALQFSQRPERMVARVGAKLLDVITPDSLESRPPPGYWRKEWLEPRGYQALFRHILVPISGEESGWLALEQAIDVARREKGSLRGLHVVEDPAQKESARALSIQEQFAKRCQEARVPGKLILESGDISRTICERSRWAALVVVNLAHPPGNTPLARLGSGFRTLLLRCARPVLAVPRVQPLDSALLAFDGSPKAWEGLYIAAYLARYWGIPLTVLAVEQQNLDIQEIANQAMTYLQSRELKATRLERTGSAAQAILGTAEEQNIDLIIMGGYGYSPVREAFLGSSVDQVLRKSKRPVMICR